jgi:tetratricopeptide (TPR) repeat protein
MKSFLMIAMLVFFVGAGLCLAAECPKCKVNAPDGANFCPQCGTQMPEGKVIDPPKHKFCYACGKALDTPKAVVAPVAAPVSAPKVCKDIPEANKLYQQGLNWKSEKGTFNRKEFYTNAINCWTEMIEKYPESDKCADAAYLTGDLCDNFSIKDYTKAEKYYQLSLAYNPNIKNDVRWRMAVLHDEQLKNFAKARVAYELVVNSNIGYEDEPKHKEKAAKRIGELKALGY